MQPRSTTIPTLADTSLSCVQAQLRTVPQMAGGHQGLTIGGLRHMLFHRGRELEEAGVVVRFGRRILIDENQFLDWLRDGQGRTIVGGGQ